ncbi:hypothetical protein P7K49_040170 [Saguinus oedipus]|uniref:Uncharacterized protein n=1 Tax=Saguinus oedipus TaxID=9490 RepID=A0ABQ9T927_SAGOE|nr:hypothetical protein P7K49_040170 [Saguinus oedipus]
METTGRKELFLVTGGSQENRQRPRRTQRPDGVEELILSDHSEMPARPCGVRPCIPVSQAGDDSHPKVGNTVCPRPGKVTFCIKETCVSGVRRPKAGPSGELSHGRRRVCGYELEQVQEPQGGCQDDPQPEEQQLGLQQLHWEQPQEPQPPLEPPQEPQPPLEPPQEPQPPLDPPQEPQPPLDPPQEPQPPLEPPQEPQLVQQQAGTQQHTGLQQQMGTQQLEPQPPQPEPQPPQLEPQPPQPEPQPPQLEPQPPQPEPQPPELEPQPPQPEPQPPQLEPQPPEQPQQPMFLAD